MRREAGGDAGWGVSGLVPLFTLDGSLGGVGVLVHAEEANVCKLLN